MTSSFATRFTRVVNVIRYPDTAPGRLTVLSTVKPVTIDWGRGGRAAVASTVTPDWPTTGSFWRRSSWSECLRVPEKV